MSTVASSVPAARVAHPSTIRVAGLSTALTAGAVVVDIRSTAQRERQGVFTGALSVDARSARDAIDPTSPRVLTAVIRASEVLLVSDDGIDAELFAWELHARGVTAVRAVDGGFEALIAHGGLRVLAGAQHVARESAAIAAH